MQRTSGKIFLLVLLFLSLTKLSLAAIWEKQGDQYYLAKDDRINFSAPGAGPNNFSSKYLKYDGINFLVAGASAWPDYGRLNLEYDNLFSLPVPGGVKVSEVHLLTGGNYSNSYEHDALMRLYGDKYFYATLSIIFVYENGQYQELSVPVFWDWFHLGPGTWLKGKARIKSLGENPVRKNCSIYHVSFINPLPLEPVKNILLTDSWIDNRPFSDVFAVTVKSTDVFEATDREDN